MSALLWKDLRINRLVLLIAVVLWFAPLAIMSSLNGYFWWKYEELMYSWAWTLGFGGMVSMTFTWVAGALLGGTAFACERADRSAEFLAYLPPTRWQNLISKLIVGLGSMVVLWGASVVLVVWIGPVLVGAELRIGEELDDIRANMLPAVSAGLLLLFGSAWFASSFAPSHNIAAGLSAGVPVAVIGVLQCIEIVLEGYDYMDKWFPSVSAVLGVIGLVGGTIIYLKRVEP